MDHMYENLQWRVTPYGLEALEGNRREYFMSPANLVEIREDADGQIYEFLVDLGLKTWVSPEFLEEAYDQALAVHAGRLPHPVDPVVLDRSRKAFRRNVQRTRGQLAGGP